MYLVCFYGLLFLTVSSRAHRYQFSSGWIPLTNDEVYSKSRISLNADGVIKASPKYTLQNPYVNIVEGDIPHTVTENWNDEIENFNLHDIRSKAMKLVKPETKLKFGQEDIINPVEPETIKSVNELQTADEESDLPDCEYSQISSRKDLNETIEEKISGPNTRKSKAILGDTSINNIKRLLIDQNTDSSDDKDDKSRFSKDVRRDKNVYKVTEDPAEAFEHNESNTVETLGYFYTPPNLNLNNPIQNNITHTFLKILSRHNIKPDDELPNYTLSRKVKAQVPTSAFMFIPVPLRVLPQFNNLKQLSVDPLLAVLMSNYGYYFPGSYGIHSRFRNLYGHLASNNIHNNKPFGSYKIFSDTDSSN